MKENIDVEIISNPEVMANTDYDKSIFDISRAIDMLSSQADRLDCLIAVASGLLCGMMDILWAGDFDLYRGRAEASKKADDFVVKYLQTEIPRTLAEDSSII